MAGNPASIRRLPATVVWLGVVSLLTDASSDMIYPLLPLYLTSVLGAGPAFVGLVEGVAETTASLLKLISGRFADRTGRRKPLTVLGYSLSSLARPLVAAASAPWMVLVIRFVDRVGKGIRSAPRDALMAQVTPPERRGAAYGYHRAMDNAGAVVGPLLGYVLYRGLHLELRLVFALAAVPGALAVLFLITRVREASDRAVGVVPRPSAQRPGAPAPILAPAARPDAAPDTPNHRRVLARYLFVVGLFTLGNASDAFLLLRARAAGVSEAGLLGLWGLHNGVKALLSHRLGALSDRLGRRRLIGLGWVLYALTYLGFGLASRASEIAILFAVYGLYYALVEGSEKALVADLAAPGGHGRAFGYFHAMTGLLSLPASLLFGALYRPEAPLGAFAVAAGFALAAALLLGSTHIPAARSVGTETEPGRSTTGAAAS